MKSLSNTLPGVLFQLAPTSAEAADSGPRNRHERRKGPRRQQVEAEQRAALSRAFALRQSQARSHEELEALEREYQRRLGEGPDFTHYRRKSNFAPPPPHRLTPAAIAKLRYAFNSMARKAWEGRDKGKHRGIITRTCKEVFNALLWMAERYAQLFPNYETIAKLAQCSRRSVALALDVLQRLGFITRHRRLRMVEGALGRKAEQDSNAYELHLPQTGIGALVLSLFRPKSECNNGPATDTVSFPYNLGGGVFHRQEGPAFGGECGEPPEAAPV